MIDKEKQLPLLLLDDKFVFPGQEIVHDFGSWPGEYGPIAGETINKAYSVLSDNQVLIGYYNDNTIAPEKVRPIAVLAKIRSFRYLNSDVIRLSLKGVSRAKISKVGIEEGIYLANYQVLEDDFNAVDSVTLKELSKMLVQTLDNVSTHWARISTPQLDRLTNGNLTPDCLDGIAQFFRLSRDQRLQLVDAEQAKERAELLFKWLSLVFFEAEVDEEVSKEVRRRMDASQREYVLREKIKYIKEQLGDTLDKDRDIEELKKLVKSNPYPPNIVDKALDEIRRYEMMPTNSSEAMVIRNYLDWLLKTPWYQVSNEQVDFNDVEAVLHRNHFGLEKPKERIMEYLAVREFSKNSKAPLLCFSGPPGIGKTSLAKSIAEALKRKFVKLSLGGVHDEAEIRGHRRTYLGSMPGRIIESMKKAGVINPVFLLDEIDKVSSDYKGDPSSALLEVLDPEQNKFFSDHYLEEPYDLSNVLFITTANYLENISPPLRDRMEIIDLSSYTEIEKLNIAKNHLIPNQAHDNGLASSKIKFSEDGILHIIRYYTREAGVRQLERSIGTICRKTVVKRLKGELKEDSQQLINIKKVKEYLGKERYDYTKKEKLDAVGVVTGLAYTEFGGDILRIEVTYFEGKGKLILTGSLGDVMKESAEIAIDYIKANAKHYGIDPQLFEKSDIHIHAPEGAVPKDGPSAGVTMTTAIVSALTSRKVLADIAMTGEVTLRGNVLPIGGLKEKAIAAHRSGIKKIYIPKENEKHLEEIPEQVKSEVSFVLVERVNQIIDAVLVESDCVKG